MIAVLVAFSLITINQLVAALRAPASHQPVPVLWDILFVFGGGALFLALVGLELRFRAVRRLLAGESPLALGVVAGALVLWFAHALFAPGLLVTGDAGSHVARVSHLAMALRDGSSLYWDNDFFAGSTALQFTGPVFHWLAAAVCLVLGDATGAVKIVVIAGRCLSAWFAFLFLRRAGCGLTAAAFGAVFYGGAFFQTAVAESVRSNFPQIINLVCLPATLLFIETILQRQNPSPAQREREGAGRAAARRMRAAGPEPKSRQPVFTRAWAALCLTVIAFIGNHQPTAVMAAILIAPYVALRFFMVRADASRLFALAAAGIVSAVGSAAFIVPFLAERSWTAEVFSPEVIQLRVPPWHDLAHFFVWGATGSGSDSSSYLGLSLLACIAAGIFFSLRRHVCRPQMRILLAVFVGLAVLSQFLGGSYVRQALFTTFFVSAAAATSVQVLLETFPTVTALPAVLLGAFLLDLGPTAIQPWVRPDMRPLQRAGEALAQEAAQSRVIETEYGPGGFFISVGPDSSPLNYARVQMLYGPHKMEATKGHNAMVAVLQNVQADLNTAGALSRQTAGLLAIYNVGWIVGHQKNRMGLPPFLTGTVPDGVIGTHLRLADATPFLVSGRILQTPMPASFVGPPFWQDDFRQHTPRATAAMQDAKQAFAAMDINLAQHQAARFLLPSVPDWARASGDAPHAQTLDYRVAPGRVRVVLTADRPGYVRLSHPFYPTLHVTENGAAVAPSPDVFSMMVLPLPAGRTDIEIVAHPSLLRIVCWWLSGLTTLGLTGIAIGRTPRGPRTEAV